MKTMRSSKMHLAIIIVLFIFAILIAIVLLPTVSGPFRSNTE